MNDLRAADGSATFQVVRERQASSLEKAADWTPVVRLDRAGFVLLGTCLILLALVTGCSRPTVSEAPETSSLSDSPRLLSGTFADDASEAIQLLFAPDALPFLPVQPDLLVCPATNRVSGKRIDLHADMTLLHTLPVEVLGIQSNLTYRLEGQTLQMRPFVDGTFTTPNGPLRVVALRLRDREFHALKAASLRKLEARKAVSHLRKVLAEPGEVPVLVLAQLFDDPGSSLVHSFLELGLEDLRPADRSGSVWTRFDSETDSYHRWDYVLAAGNPGFHAVLDSETRAVFVRWAAE